MKKRNLFLLGALALFSAITISSRDVKIANAEEVNTHSVQVHYRRAIGKYDAADLWIWNISDGGEGTAIEYTSTDDYGGVTDVITLTSLPGSTSTPASEIGLIMRPNKGSWSGQSADIKVSLPTLSESGICHIYLMEGSNSYDFSIPESGYIKSASFIKMNKIKASIFMLDGSAGKDDISIAIYGDDEIVEIKTYTFNATNGDIDIELVNDVDLNKTYQLKVTYKSKTFSSYIDNNGIYDEDAFVNAFTYEGDDLGAVIDKVNNKTTFKLWAPTSSKVQIKLYQTGTPSSLGGSDVAETYDMIKQEKGVWYFEKQGNLHNTYYTYVVTNSAGTNEVIDPYAKGCGVNGIRGLVVDFEKINPEGFEYGKRANSITKRADASIYELHIRDYTKDENWGGNSSWSGKYLGLTQTGTTYNGVSTGLDNLKELGVTNIQIMPIYDQATVDESVSNPSYNWGYDPLNYNCLEGSYATDAFDGLVRIKEFKQMIMALTEAGIRVNMDVVYNHTAKSSDSNFELIVPGYYHRLNSDGSFSNGSGCGNEMASERPMVRKFMVDSTKFLYTEYNLSGFRFDLMELIDKTTMMDIYDTIYEIDPLTLIYGEPWTGGTSSLANGQGTNKSTVRTIVKKDEDGNIIGGVGKFNDDTRDAIVGRVPSPNSPGWLQGDAESYTRTFYDNIRFGITGGTFRRNSSYVDDATQTINYVSCHDNNTLWDKLQLSTYASNWKIEGDVDQIGFKKMYRQADTIVFLSEGIPFIQEGQEFLRSKPKVDGYGEGSIYDHNSYRSPDEVNKVRWKLKSDNTDIFNYYKDLIQFRKNHEAFKMNSASEIEEKLEFLYTDDSSSIVYRLTEEKDQYQDMIVIHNTSEKATITLPDGKWKVAFDKTGIVSDDTIYEGSIKIAFNESVVLYNINSVNNNDKTPSSTKKSCGKSAVSIVSMISLLSVIFVIGFKKKESLGI